MRKLILQIQTSLDMYVCDQIGSTEGFIWNWEPEWTWDDNLQREFIELKKSIDCILLSRKMATQGFIDHWHSIANQESNSESRFARLIDSAKKVIFSRNEGKSEWPNSDYVKGNLASTINQLKNQDGKNIIVYGGAEFANEVVKTGLLDELHLYVNPIVFGGGNNIFTGIPERTNLRLVDVTGYKCGVAVMKYKKET